MSLLIFKHNYFANSGFKKIVQVECILFRKSNLFNLSNFFFN